MSIDGEAIDWRSNRELIAKHLHTVLTHGEQEKGGDNRPKTKDLRQLIVLLDNADDIMAIRLRDSLEKVLHMENLITVRTLVNIVYLVTTSGPGPDMPSRPKINLLSTEVTHDLYEEEKGLFTTRLDQWKEHDPASILEFVVMASNFKVSSSTGIIPFPRLYVQGG